jgi:tRNA G10  N-methylase Trm11
MKQTLFIFGRTPDLSFLELSSLYPTASLVAPGIATIADFADDPNEVIRQLGGTVKIVEAGDAVDAYTEDTLLSALIGETRENHITFGISAYGTQVSHGLTASLKKRLTERGVIARYVETKHDEVLSSVVVAKQQVVEIVLITIGKSYRIGVTRAVQDFEDWNKRDFGRPAVDPKAGMLPPKVARMIVNIALAGRDTTHTAMLMDPFCGVGTVLGEALLRGASVVGCDLSEDAVQHTKKNLEWLRKNYPIAAPLYANIYTGDATHVSTHVANGSIDAIVTEPFMGEPVDTKNVATLTPERVKNVLKGLEKLYIGALKDWATVLKNDGRIVMAMPAYATRRAVMRVKNVVDRCESLGYTLLAGPIEYSRPQAIVRREFYVFKKVKK